MWERVNQVDPPHTVTDFQNFATSDDQDQSEPPPSIIRIFTVRHIFWSQHRINNHAT